MRRVEKLLHATAIAEARHFWFRGFRRFVTPLLETATRGLSAVRLLDCGCGTGANLEMLGRYGKAFGFDLTAAGLELGRAAGRTRLARATVTAVPFPAGAFDVVTSFDVLYALEGDVLRAAVAEMFRVARPGGFLIVNVAAMNCLRGDHSILGGEVQRFSRASLRKVLTDAGFDILRLTHTNASLFVPMFLVRAVQRWRGLKSEAAARQDITVPPAPVNGLLTAVLYAEGWWLQRFDASFGSSLLCLARKPARTGTNKS
jgi:SAM-dependent methyltransferase